MVNITIEQTKSGVPTLKIDNYYIHSKYNPVIEAERFVENSFKDRHITILFGYGLGYIAQAYKNKLPIDKQKYILVYDPLIGKLKSFIDINTDDMNIFHRLSNVVEFLWKNFRNEINKINVVCTPNYDKLFPQEYVELMKEIKDYQNNQIVNFATIIKLSVPWEENYSKNRLYMVNDPSLKVLESKFDCPVVIAASGPSLSKQLPLLKQIRENILLIAAGSTVRPLILNGITPDFVVTVDPKKTNLRHYIDLDLGTSMLIYTPQNYYEIRPLFKQAFTFLPSYDEDYFFYYWNLLGKEYPLLGYGGSCANYAFVVATYISKGPIALIGQDLAYTNGSSHADGNKGQYSISEAFIKERGLFEVEGYNGEKVYTSTVFYGMKKSFESMIQQLNLEQPVFNCTEGGLKIEGFEQLSFQEFISQYVHDGKISFELSQLNDEKSENLESLQLKIREERKLCKEIINLCQDARELLKEAVIKGELSSKLSKKLDKIDKDLCLKLKKVNLNQILQPITIRVENLYIEQENETETERFKRVISQNLEFYELINEAVEQSIKFNRELDESIKCELERDEIYG